MIVEDNRLLSFLDEIRGYAEEMRNKNVSEADKRNIDMEWKLLSKVVDRICLIIFSLVCIIASVVILTSSPYQMKFVYCKGALGSCDHPDHEGH